MDRLFDSVNSSTFQVPEGKPLRGPLKKGSAHEHFWAEVNQILKSMRFIDRENPTKSSVPPSIKNWVTTIHGFQLIWKNLKADDVDFLFMRNFNLDPLENFFGLMRSHGSRNVNPSCSAFIAAFKTLVLNNFIAVKSVGTNCEADDSEGALLTLRELLQPEENQEPPTHIDINIPEPNFNIYESRISIQVSNYVSGFVLNKLHPIIVGCQTCKNDFTTTEIGTPHHFILEREYIPEKMKLKYLGYAAVASFMEIKKMTYYILENNIHIKKNLVTIN